MGTVKEGSVRGVIPTGNLFAINYPGYPSIERAVETLGGEDGIAKVRSSDGYLELRYRPEDPDSHCAFGELHRSSCLLLRLSKKSKSSSEEASQNLKVGNRGWGSRCLDHEHSNPSIVSALETSGQEDDLRAEIVARMEEFYDFNGMADYQYVLPVHAELSRVKKRRRAEHQYEQGNAMDLEEEEMMMIVPPVFSSKDIPEDVALQPSVIITKKKKTLVQYQWEMDVIPCFNLDFKIKDVPPKINWEDKLLKGSVHWHLQAAVSKLFEERPIWAKNTLNERLIEQGVRLTDLQLKRFLFRTSYYFGYGPFRMLMIRNGYDPRIDPESRIYQMIDFRMPKPLRKEPESFTRVKETSKLNASWKDICSFKAAPTKIFTCLQLCDLEDEYIQSQIRMPPEQFSCHEYSGWFQPSTIVRLRLQVRVRFLKFIHGDAARDLENLEASRLQRLKHRHEIASATLLHNSLLRPTSTLMENLLDCNLEQRSVPTNVEACVPTKGDDEDDEILGDEEEEEEEEDEFYEEIQPAEACRGGAEYYEPVDNIPKNYLQELLGKFPLNTAGEENTTMGGYAGGLFYNDDEDAEYVIYEQEDEDEE